MDIKAKIEEIVKKLQSDKTLLASFQSEPIKTVEKLLDIDLPGFKKDELQVELENGYLTIRAEKGLDKDETDKKGRYIRQERYAGALSRSFYVGEGFTVDDMHAKFEDGILQISVPKEAPKALPKKNVLSIE